MIQKKHNFLLLFLFLTSIALSQESLNYFDIAIQKKASSLKKEINFNKAQSFFFKEEWDSTLVYSMKQLNFDSDLETKEYCHYFRGYSLKKKGLYKQALVEFGLIDKSFQYYYLVDYNVGHLFHFEKNFEKAIVYFLKSENEILNHNDENEIANLYTNIGICYMHLNKFDNAESYLKKETLLNPKKATKSLVRSYINIANFYYEQYKDEQGIYYFQKAYKLSKNIKDFKLKENSAFNMAVVEENRADYKKALVYRKESEQWKDSLNNQNKIWAVADFEKKFAVAQKQKQIKVLEVENKLKDTQRNSLFFASIGLLLILTGGVYLYGQKVKNAKTILLQKNKLDELNATKDQLFSIVSHDLRSSVNALKTSNAKLSATLETKNYDELHQLIIQNSTIANGAYSLLDNLLHWAMLQTKQLYFHKESIHLYSIVQQIEYNYKPLLLDKAITFENSVSKNIFIFVDLDSLKIVLRNLLDNAIKFSNENGKISFYTQETNPDFCDLIIEDNGIGMSENTIKELLQEGELLAKKSGSEIIGTGLGLQLCKQMIRKNSGTLAIESEINKGTKMILSFPKTRTNG
ncbi:Adaptive-response sensory-kinase SasA [Flavobacterium bizetiae]|uniref:histidine kinase n=1 Tax=Flavobacterium bizetiae TaxID=2704140 RepID=A0A6J4GM87_9FLAO|nr:ATP-binding protein [Flavobacterium bizetiae]CAA9198598.1 Adaptive-response sensory-kinase SasA [Flavobacterium bizetiae]CAD5341092.1 Adaptive-response sensory-kinase SasA [Flavobacterium bizetiae]CAD5347227.1 Adaptive-response sensory-kinase SasA [Flavobacterium bizetiae]